MSARVRVRAARPEDVPRVWTMLVELAVLERLTDFLTGDADRLHAALFGDGPRLECLVAEAEGGALVGYALTYQAFGSFRTRWRTWLEDLYVEPSHRGTGAGRALLAAVARRAAERDDYAVDWEVLDWNDPAIRFYEGQGATRIATDWYRYRLAGAPLESLAREGGGG